jgi:hypothetical protein
MVCALMIEIHSCLIINFDPFVFEILLRTAIHSGPPCSMMFKESVRDSIPPPTVLELEKFLRQSHPNIKDPRDYDVLTATINQGRG